MCFEILQEEGEYDNKKQQDSILCDAAVLTVSHNVCTSHTQRHDLQQTKCLKLKDLIKSANVAQVQQFL